MRITTSSGRATRWNAASTTTFRKRLSQGPQPEESRRPEQATEGFPFFPQTSLSVPARMRPCQPSRPPPWGHKRGEEPPSRVACGAAAIKDFATVAAGRSRSSKQEQRKQGHRSVLLNPPINAVKKPMFGARSRICPGAFHFGMSS